MGPFRAQFEVSKPGMFRALLFFTLFAALMTPTGVAAERSSRDVVIIVNRQNAATTVSKEFLRRAFLKQVTRWQDDETVRPADQVATATARKRFSESILGRSVQAVKSYWQQRVFSGRDIPPPEFATEEAVVEYVSRYPGAIGYVSSGAVVDAAKVVVVH
jgi:ABC-type phosphate transport system substrate-binding protein